MAHLLRSVLFLSLLLLIGTTTVTVWGLPRKEEISHLYCQPLSEATPGTPMIARFTSTNLLSELHGKRVRFVKTPWPSILDRVYYVNTAWDGRWYLLHEDPELQQPGRPAEGELELHSRNGLVEGNGVAIVEILDAGE
ncbi:uncharacterized protein TM35_000102290 [Trypanosoma theileri]|uniref:Uncharacterized protein n=1 Tax=Trypanosoma theileri TaxID=67003 RepID=A0A1X0NZD3_9TRYP|nr:uncharacterized protein TM35_000102290 [Trypanosoma theileri]ORC89961.1 hypothetical protein TM35_000102290 [Trypanosoma theileri]